MSSSPEVAQVSQFETQKEAQSERAIVGREEQMRLGGWYVRPITSDPQAVVGLELSSEHERDLNGAVK